MFQKTRHNFLKRRLIFITGCPRSGTSLMTKIIDSHPDIAILMENIFNNRRRHWTQAEFWKSSGTLAYEVGKVYSRLKEPIVGNKVCTPDVWLAEDINMFCNLFESFKILFVVRDPRSVAMSRMRREDHDKHFNMMARKYLLLNFKTRWDTYISSWRQSIEVYWKLKDHYQNNVYSIYYEDLLNNFETEVKNIFKFLGIPFSEKVIHWYEIPHYNKNGNLQKDLKYVDRPIFENCFDDSDFTENLNTAIQPIKWQFQLWQKREL